MQKRHADRQNYFQEQILVTEKYVLPYIENTINISGEMTVAEIGCGEGGNLKPFLDLGCHIVGIDIAENKIENAREYYSSHPGKANARFIAEDIYNLRPEDTGRFDLIIMRDTIEHIPHQERFLGMLKNFLKPDGRIFFAFPPWRMPFGGHQQICENKFLSLMPYIHLLPTSLYKSVLKLFGESSAKIRALQEIKDTGISISRFKSYLKRNNYQIEKETCYLINPNYEIKFKLKVRKLPVIINVPHLSDFYTTAYYCMVRVLPVSNE